VVKHFNLIDLICKTTLSSIEFSQDSNKQNMVFFNTTLFVKENNSIA